MANEFHTLLDATIQHLEGLKARGARHVAVTPATLQALRKPLAKTQAPAAGPAPAAPVKAPGRVQAGTPAARTLPSSSLPLSSKTPLQGAEKEKAMRALAARVTGCTKCPRLPESRTQTVFGVGTVHARLMFVGEAPGADEDAQGEPFVGRAGQLLTKIIETMGLQRGEVYIGNILKCRPDTPGQSSGNRKPTPVEMATCLGYLEEQIGIIQPQVMVALGATAVQGLLGQQVAGRTMGSLRGDWLEWRGIPLMVTYHPAYLLRNQSLTEKRKVWEDMLKVMAKLELPISAKQRGFFLKK
ncbi:MAG: uracil-DNA glycosylase [Verrucomicrobiales bacterium]|nr:uracil-DNA glycosylase [Verrucomicrobiales bacterium]